MEAETGMSDTINGLWVAIATPIGADGSVDRAALLRHVKGLMDAGADGVVPFGTTGEGTSFSAAERLAAVEALLAGGIAPGCIGLGTGCPAVTDTIDLTKATLALGLHHVLMLPPYYYRDADAQGIEDAFAAILDGIADDRLRVTLYNIPQTSGVPVPPEVAARLRQRYGKLVAGVKDSTGVFENFRAFREAAPDLAIVVGNEADIGRAVAEGGAGTICGMANVVPGVVRAMFTEPSALAPMQAALGLMQAPWLATLKSVIAAQTGDAGWLRMRPPLRAVDAAIGQKIAAAMAGLAADKAA
jgi:4-hydroxy-tetrahydrodipicolinate synthase